MKIALCTGGTRGDVQPMLALAVALIEAGHEVILAGPPENKAWVESYDCPFAGLSINVEEFIDNLSANMTLVDMFRFMKELKRGVITQLSDFPPIIEGHDLVNSERYLRQPSFHLHPLNQYGLSRDARLPNAVCRYRSP